MLTHIVIWKSRGDIEQEVREEHVGLLRALVGDIPALVSLSVGFDLLRLPRSYIRGWLRVDSRSRGARGLHRSSHTLSRRAGQSIASTTSVYFEN